MTVWVGFGFAQNKSQQSTHPSTLFFSTIRRLAANTPFSARFHNNLTFNTLQSFNFIKRASSNTPHHETCLTAMRNMPNRSSIHGKRWLDTWSLAARLGIFRNNDAPKMEFQTHLATFKCAKCMFRSLFRPKIATYFSTKTFNDFCGLGLTHHAITSGKRSMRLPYYTNQPHRNRFILHLERFF